MTNTEVTFAFKLNAYARPGDSPYSEFRDLVLEAEKLDYDGAWLIDHLTMPNSQLAGFSNSMEADRPFFPDTWTMLGALAAETKSIRLGPQVTPLFRLHPVNLARAGAAIDWITGGRFVLQVGAGWNEEEYRQFGLPYPDTFTERYERTVEGVRMIRSLWTSSEPVSFQGKHYTLEDAPLWPKPTARPSPEIWIGGSGKKMRRATAELGDAWTPAAPHYDGMPPNLYAESWAEIQNLAADDFDRDPSGILPAAFFFVVIDETTDAAVKRAENLLKRPLWEGLSVEELRRRGIAMIGDPGEVGAALQSYVDVGVKYFSIAFMPISGYEETRDAMELFRREVMSKFPKYR